MGDVTAEPTHGAALRSDGARRELTSFVGRRQAVARLGAELRRSRLVTITGPGGVGKARTALTVARAARADFPDGVRVV